MLFCNLIRVRLVILVASITQVQGKYPFSERVGIYIGFKMIILFQETNLLSIGSAQFTRHNETDVLHVQRTSLPLRFTRASTKQHNQDISKSTSKLVSDEMTSSDTNVNNTDLNDDSMSKLSITNKFPTEMDSTADKQFHTEQPVTDPILGNTFLNKLFSNEKSTIKQSTGDKSVSQLLSRKISKSDFENESVATGGNRIVTLRKKLVLKGPHISDLKNTSEILHREPVDKFNGDKLKYVHVFGSKSRDKRDLKEDPIIRTPAPIKHDTPLYSDVLYVKDPIYLSSMKYPVKRHDKQRSAELHKQDMSSSYLVNDKKQAPLIPTYKMRLSNKERNGVMSKALASLILETHQKKNRNLTSSSEPLHKDISFSSDGPTLLEEQDEGSSVARQKENILSIISQDEGVSSDDVSPSLHKNAGDMSIAFQSHQPSRLVIRNTDSVRQSIPVDKRTQGNAALSSQSQISNMGTQSLQNLNNLLSVDAPVSPDIPVKVSQYQVPLTQPESTFKFRYSPGKIPVALNYPTGYESSPAATNIRFQGNIPGSSNYPTGYESSPSATNIRSPNKIPVSSNYPTGYESSPSATNIRSPNKIPVSSNYPTGYESSPSATNIRSPNKIPVSSNYPTGYESSPAATNIRFQGNIPGSSNYPTGYESSPSATNIRSPNKIPVSSNYPTAYQSSPSATNIQSLASYNQPRSLSLPPPVPDNLAMLSRHQNTPPASQFIPPLQNISYTPSRSALSSNYSVGYQLSSSKNNQSLESPGHSSSFSLSTSRSRYSASLPSPQEAPLIRELQLSLSVQNVPSIPAWLPNNPVEQSGPENSPYSLQSQPPQYNPVESTNVLPPQGEQIYNPVNLSEFKSLPTLPPEPQSLPSFTSLTESVPSVPGQLQNQGHYSLETTECVPLEPVNQQYLAPISQAYLPAPNKQQYIPTLTAELPNKQLSGSQLQQFQEVPVPQTEVPYQQLPQLQPLSSVPDLYNQVPVPSGDFSNEPLKPQAPIYAPPAQLPNEQLPMLQPISNQSSFPSLSPPSQYLAPEKSNAVSNPIVPDVLPPQVPSAGVQISFVPELTPKSILFPLANEPSTLNPLPLLGIGEIPLGAPQLPPSLGLQNQFTTNLQSTQIPSSSENKLMPVEVSTKQQAVSAMKNDVLAPQASRAGARPAELSVASEALPTLTEECTTILPLANESPTTSGISSVTSTTLGENQFPPKKQKQLEIMESNTTPPQHRGMGTTPVIIVDRRLNQTTISSELQTTTDSIHTAAHTVCLNITTSNSATTGISNSADTTITTVNSKSHTVDNLNSIVPNSAGMNIKTLNSGNSLITTTPTYPSKITTTLKPVDKSQTTANSIITSTSTTIPSSVMTSSVKTTATSESFKNTVVCIKNGYIPPKTQVKRTMKRNSQTNPLTSSQVDFRLKTVLMGQKGHGKHNNPSSTLGNAEKILDVGCKQVDPKQFAHAEPYAIPSVEKRKTDDLLKEEVGLPYSISDFADASSDLNMEQSQTTAKITYNMNDRLEETVEQEKEEEPFITGIVSGKTGLEQPKQQSQKRQVHTEKIYRVPEFVKIGRKQNTNLRKSQRHIAHESNNKLFSNTGLKHKPHRHKVYRQHKTASSSDAQHRTLAVDTSLA